VDFQLVSHAARSELRDWVKVSSYLSRLVNSAIGAIFEGVKDQFHCQCYAESRNPGRPRHSPFIGCRLHRRCFFIAWVITDRPPRWQIKQTTKEAVYITLGTSALMVGWFAFNIRTGGSSLLPTLIVLCIVVAVYLASGEKRRKKFFG
jgi:hypothetical protein